MTDQHGIYNPECDCLLCESEHVRVTGHHSWCDMIHDGQRECSCGADRKRTGTSTSVSPSASGTKSQA